MKTKIQALDFLIATGVSLLLDLFNGRAKKEEKEKKEEECVCEGGEHEASKFTILSNIMVFFLALSHFIIVYPFFHSENPGSH